MKAFGSDDSLGIRVLSPRIDPPVLEEEGSTAYLRQREEHNVTTCMYYTITVRVCHRILA